MIPTTESWLVGMSPREMPCADCPGLSSGRVADALTVRAGYVLGRILALEMRYNMQNTKGPRHLVGYDRQEGDFRRQARVQKKNAGYMRDVTTR